MAEASMQCASGGLYKGARQGRESVTGARLGSEAHDLLGRLSKSEINSIDRVIGLEPGDGTFASELARSVSARRKSPCAESESIFALDQMAIGDGERILLASNMLVIPDRVCEAVAAIEQAGAMALLLILSRINLTGLRRIGGRRIVALEDYPEM
ncbi:MAG TPA: hypothetical protein VF829_02170 [Candidatus Paceibacterota bacterium]